MLITVNFPTSQIITKPGRDQVQPQCMSTYPGRKPSLLYFFVSAKIKCHQKYYYAYITGNSSDEDNDEYILKEKYRYPNLEIL